MTTPFVSELRSRRTPIRLAAHDAASITIRVEMPEVWDVVRVVASPAQPVIEVKRAALEALYPEATSTDDFVLKLRGWEILDEGASLLDNGVGNASILLLTFRRRRPVR